MTKKINEILNKKEINGEDLEELIKAREQKNVDFLLVDVREEYEFNNIRIEGVDYLIPLSKFYEKVREIEGFKDQPIIMQCKLGGRSQQAQRQLEIMGFNKVINLAGGITEYLGKKIHGN
tara:strand:+ start:17 stop:376 length:360 start_codon:yes stop_codon:yes gene_type:complete